MIFSDSLGITNYSFVEAVENNNNSIENTIRSDREKAFCSFVPIPGILCGILVALELTRLIIVTVKEIKKIIHQQNQVHNFPLPALPPQNNPLSSFSLNLPPAMNSTENITTPSEMNVHMESHGSTREIIEIIELSNVGTTAAADKDTDDQNVNTSTNEVTVEDMEAFDQIEHTARSMEETSAGSEETLARNKQTLAKNEETLARNKELLARNKGTLDRNEVTFARYEETLARNEETLAYSKGTSAKNKMIARIEESSARNERTLVRTEESSDRNLGTLARYDEISARNEETAASTDEPPTASEIPGNPSSLTENDKSSVTVHRRAYRTGAETVKNTLKQYLYRTGTLLIALSVLAFLTWIPLYLNDDDKSAIYPRLISRLIMRFLNFLLPLVWILFEVDIRIYTFLKLRQIWFKLCNFNI